MNALPRIQRIIEAGRNLAITDAGRSRIDCIILYTEGYAEPGYSDPANGVIACGNWNSISRFNHPKVAKCDVGTGTARVRVVTPQEFVEGRAMEF